MGQYTDFFNPNNPDSRLYEELVNESVKFYGAQAYYMVRSSLTTEDVIFGDDPAKLFNEAYEMPMYIQTVDQFEGFEAISKFGLEVRKQARFLVTTRIFNQAMPNGFGRPREGDILWLQNFKAFFEIKKADEEHMFYTFGKEDIYGYSLVCEKWNYDQATVNTGIDVIDSTADSIVITYDFHMGDGRGGNGAGTFTPGETLTGNTSGATGIITSWNKPTKTMEVRQINGVFGIGETAHGDLSGAVWTIESYNIRDNVNDAMDDNQNLADEADTFMMFDPNNPFGTPSE